MAQAALGRRPVAKLKADVVVVGAGLAGCSTARFLAESGASVLAVDRAGIGAGASGRNGGFLFRQPADWINELLTESVAIYEEIGVELQPWPMLVLAVEEDELPAARAYADAVGGEEIDLRADPWFADDLAGGFVVEEGYIVDAMGATVAMAEAARQAGAEFRLHCEAKQLFVDSGRVHGVMTDAGVVECDRVMIATGPRLRFLLRTVGLELPVAATRGWLLETGQVDPPPRYAVEQALWPLQDEMGALAGAPTLSEVAEGSSEEPGIVSLLLGGRPAGHCLIGTSLSRSLLEEPEGPETVRRLAERAVRVSPALRDVPVVAAWSGRRALSPDGLPAVGPIPGVEGVDVVGAFSSIGMVTIPAACRRLVRGGADLFDPGRLL